MAMASLLRRSATRPFIAAVLSANSRERGSMVDGRAVIWCRQATRVPLASPLPAGERSAHEVRRVRGIGTLDEAGPPHPNPLPTGERERTELAAASSHSP